MSGVNVITAGRTARRWLATFIAVSMISPGELSHLHAQPAPVAPRQASEIERFDVQQLDALLAPVALYPDQLLTQVLIAATFPIDIVQAARWIEEPAHKDLIADALTQALTPLSWDPSVKSLTPFPQILAQLNGNLDWTQQLGYAFANQQSDVLDSVQRLRRQAQSQGNLQSTSQQVVRTETGTGAAMQTIVIVPAQPNVVYVPIYNPTIVYGPWPYPSSPPVVPAPSPGYVAGTALLGGLAFGAGIAITSELWGWSSPNWGAGSVNVNVNRWNNINVNRQHAVSSTWSQSLNRHGARPANLQRPPNGPVGSPIRNAGLAANAIGRREVSVPGNLVKPPARPNPPAVKPGDRPNLSPGSRPRQPADRPPINRPPVNRPPAGAKPERPAPAQQPAGAGRTALGQGGTGQRLSERPAQSRQPGQSALFGGVNDGSRAAAFGQRGGQSRQAGSWRAKMPPGGAARGGNRGGFRDRR